MMLRSPTVAKYNAVLEHFKNKNIQFEIEEFLKDFPTSKVDGEVKEILIQKLKEIFPLKKIYYPIGKKIIKTGTKLNRIRILDKNENNLDVREYSKFSALGSPDPLKVNVRAGRFNRKQESKLYTAYSLEVAKKEVDLSLGDVYLSIEFEVVYPINVYIFDEESLELSKIIYKPILENNNRQITNAMKEIFFDLLDNDVKGIEMKSTKVHFGDKLWVENTASGDKFKNNNVVLNFSAEHNSLKVSKVNIMKCMGENKDICIYEGFIINNQIQYIKK